MSIWDSKNRAVVYFREKALPAKYEWAQSAYRDGLIAKVEPGEKAAALKRLNLFREESKSDKSPLTKEFLKILDKVERWIKNSSMEKPFTLDLSKVFITIEDLLNKLLKSPEAFKELEKEGVHLSGVFNGALSVIQSIFLKPEKLLKARLFNRTFMTCNLGFGHANELNYYFESCDAKPSASEINFFIKKAKQVAKYLEQGGIRNDFSDEDLEILNNLKAFKALFSSSKAFNIPELYLPVLKILVPNLSQVMSQSWKEGEAYPRQNFFGFDNHKTERGSDSPHISESTLETIRSIVEEMREYFTDESRWNNPMLLRLLKSIGSHLIIMGETHFKPELNESSREVFRDLYEILSSKDFMFESFEAADLGLFNGHDRKNPGGDLLHTLLNKAFNNGFRKESDEYMDKYHRYLDIKKEAAV